MAQPDNQGDGPRPRQGLRGTWGPWTTTHTGGVQMSQPSAMLFEFNDAGQIARAEFHLDRVEALRVAGLEP